MVNTALHIQRIFWTTVPNGRTADGKLRFSVTVTPQFRYEVSTSDGGTNPKSVGLWNFPKFVDWPETVRDLLGLHDNGLPDAGRPGFVLQFKDGKTNKLIATSARARLISAVPSSPLWKSIFPENLPVLGMAPAVDRGSYIVRPFVERELVKSFRTLYGKVASDVNVLSKPSLMQERYKTEYGKLNSTPLDIYKPSAGNSTIQQNPGTDSIFQPKTGNILTNIVSRHINVERIREALVRPLRYFRARFYDGVQAVGLEVPANIKPSSTGSLEVNKQVIANYADLLGLGNFQSHLAMLQDYPELLRELGLILDFEVESGAIKNSENILVSVQPGGLGTGAFSGGTSIFQIVTIRPETSCYVSDKEFRTNNWGGLPDKMKNLFSEGYLRIREENLLTLEEKHFEVDQLDEDGVATTVVSYQEQLSQSAGVHPRLPLVRDDGFALNYRHKHELQSLLFRRWNDLQGKILESDDNPELYPYADPTYFGQDIARGYRIDAFVQREKDGLGKWYPLCRRSLTVNVGGVPRQYPDTPNHKVEGQVTNVLSRLPKDGSKYDTSKVVYRMKPSIFTWRGWSLSVPTCGQVNQSYSSEDTGILNAGDCAASAASPDLPNLNVQVKTVPGTLPMLRYGWHYRFRARVVDAAGNSRPAPDPATDPFIPADDIEDLPTVSDAHVYRRMDAVSSPVAVMAIDPKALLDGKHRVTSPGESVEHMVIRSNYRDDKSLEPGNSETIRYFVPPPVSVMTPERHGRLDNEKGGFSGEVMLHTLKGDISVYKFLKYRQNRNVLGHSLNENKPFVWKDENPQAGDHYFATTGYIADPIARGVAFHGLPSSEGGKPVTLNYAGIKIDGDNATDTWPDVGRVEFVLRTGDSLAHTPTLGRSAYASHDNLGRLTVSLPKAEMVTIEYSSFMSGKDLELMYWYMQNPNAEMKAKAIKGENWMLTPPRKMTLVHAVKQPLLNPSVIPIADISNMLRRDAGSTSVLVEAIVEVHGKSTGEIGLTAAWDDYVFDADTDSGYQIVQKEVHAFDATIDLSGEPIPGINGGSGVFLFNKETKSDALVLGGKAYEALVAAQDGDTRSGGAGMIPFVKKIPTVKDDSKEDRKQRSEMWPPHLDMGDTKHHKITFNATAVTRFREYFNPMRKGRGEDELDMALEKTFTRPDPVVKEAARRSIQVHVPSSARPAAPEVDYIVPTFGWTETKSGGVTTRKRHGAGLRIYLKGPWYGTGEDERLAVILYRRNPSRLASFFDRPTRFNEYVSRWNHDPIHRRKRLDMPGKQSDTYLTADNFSVGFIDKPTDLELVELSKKVSQKIPVQEWKDGITITNFKSIDATQGDLVDAVTYDVKYDKEKKRFYCDIQFDKVPGYFPFVRLALARYQPYSVPGKHLSPVVKAEFMQLCPDRQSTVQLVESNSKALISVSGTSHAGGKHPTTTKNLADIDRHEEVKPPVYKTGKPLSAQTVKQISMVQPTETMQRSDIQVNGKVATEAKSVPNKSNKLISLSLGNFVSNENSVSVELERLITGRNTDDPLGWEPVDTKAAMLTTNLSGWEGVIPIPGDYAPNKYRVVIREHEHFQPGASRVVYIDAVVL